VRSGIRVAGTIIAGLLALTGCGEAPGKPLAAVPSSPQAGLPTPAATQAPSEMPVSSPATILTDQATATPAATGTPSQSAANRRPTSPVTQPTYAKPTAPAGPVTHVVYDAAGCCTGRLGPLANIGAAELTYTYTLHCRAANGDLSALFGWTPTFQFGPGDPYQTVGVAVSPLQTDPDTGEAYFEKTGSFTLTATSRSGHIVAMPTPTCSWVLRVTGRW
jgi:hypothetical protein